MSNRNRKKAERRKNRINEAIQKANHHVEFLLGTEWYLKWRYQIPAGLPLQFPTFSLDVIEKAELEEWD